MTMGTSAATMSRMRWRIRSQKRFPNDVSGNKRAARAVKKDNGVYFNKEEEDGREEVGLRRGQKRWERRGGSGGAGVGGGAKRKQVDGGDKGVVHIWTATGAITWTLSFSGQPVPRQRHLILLTSTCTQATKHGCCSPLYLNMPTIPFVQNCCQSPTSHLVLTTSLMLLTHRRY